MRSRETKQKSLGLLALLLGMLPAATGLSQTNPWPFDFDPQIAADPGGVNSRLQELGDGVPAIPAGDLVAAQVGPMTLYFHQAMLELLELARDSGPGTQEYFQRVYQLCSAHHTLAPPTLLVTGASASCRQTEQQIQAVLEDPDESCARIEFPELYVYDQPVGEADHDDLKNLEGLISVVGEVLTHIDYPANVLPQNFEQEARTVIAKIRYQTLLGNAQRQRQSYNDSKALLHDNASCFESSASQTLQTTIDSLIGELDAAMLHLQGIYDRGLTQAAADRHAVEAQGRLRVDLPHPSLTDRERELLALYIGGFYWRMRGSALLDYPESGLLRRLIYVQYPYQVIADITGGLTDAADIGRDIFIHETWGYADWMDVGRNPGNDKYSDMIDMAKRGKRTLDLAEPHLRTRGFDTAYLYAGGLQMGPCYYYGWEPLWEPEHFQLGEDLPDPYMWFLECPTAHGEFCTGGALGVGLARTMLWGKPNTGCVPNCVDRVCGDNRCNGSCGTCTVGSCNSSGQCEGASSDAGVADTRRPDSWSADSRGVDHSSADAASAVDSSRPDGESTDSPPQVDVDASSSDSAHAADNAAVGTTPDSAHTETTTTSGGCSGMGTTHSVCGWVALASMAVWRQRRRR